MVAVLIGFSGACSGSPGPGDCPAGHRAEGPACIPIFDQCSGPAEKAVLGGGCMTVGVLDCGAGFTPDGLGGCDATLPADLCPPGEIAVPGETSCRAVGATTCGAGFAPASDGGGGCDPVLPPAPCAPHEVALLGETACQPLRDCGAAPWGNIPGGAQTIYVDAAYAGPTPSGTASDPYVTVGEALLQVAPGGQIAVAAGDYFERLQIGKAVGIVGRCPELVRIHGQAILGQDQPPVEITIGGSGTVIEGLTLMSDIDGLIIDGAAAVVVRESAVVDAGYYGVWVANGAEVLLDRVVVSRSTTAGVHASESTLELRDSVVRQTRPRADGAFGRGVSSDCDGAGCGPLTITRSLIADNHQAGVLLLGVDAVIEDSAILRTLPIASNDTNGRGISAQCSPIGCGSLEVTGSVVADNREVGISASGTAVTIRNTTVRGTLPQRSDNLDGFGVLAACNQAAPPACGALAVSDSTVRENTNFGINAEGVGLSVADSYLWGTLQTPESDQGRALSAGCLAGSCPAADVSNGLVEENEAHGVVSNGAHFVLHRSVVRDTMPWRRDDTRGWGVALDCDFTDCGSLTIRGSMVTDSYEFGVGANGPTAIERSVVARTLPRRLDGINALGVSTFQAPTGITQSLLVDNQGAGLLVDGGDATAIDVTVRNTLPQEPDDLFGFGLGFACRGACDSSVLVQRSSVLVHRDAGIFAEAQQIVIAGVVVAENAAGAFEDGKFARGMILQCDDDSTCPLLEITDTLIRDVVNVGLYLWGPHTMVDGLEIRNVVSTTTGVWAHQFGQAIWAQCDLPGYGCGEVSIRGLNLQNSVLAGIAFEGMSGLIESSAISGVAARGTDQSFGFGIQVARGSGTPDYEPAVHLRLSSIENAHLAGILYSNATGSVSRSSITGGSFSVALGAGADPLIGTDNNLVGLLQNDPAVSDLSPSPAPEPALPPGV